MLQPSASFKFQFTSPDSDIYKPKDEQMYEKK
jgi:hypothetical protein